MTKAAPDILARIIEHKSRDIEAAKACRAAFEKHAQELTRTRRDFRAALASRPRAVIAEIKKASPSRGLIAANFEPAATAREYQAGGAACLSVLTDAEFFQGSLEHLEEARAASSLPVLRKDFTIRSVQVVEAAAHGADAVLLIAAVLDDRRLRDYREEAARFGMAAIVEVHDEEEADRAVASGAHIIGVNNRNLRTFEVTLDTSLRLAERIPDGVLRVSESGIRSAQDIARLEAAGFRAFLVGEHLMASGRPRQALAELLA